MDEPKVEYIGLRPKVEYVELRRRDPDEAFLYAASTVAAQRRELAEIRAMLGLSVDAPHELVIRELQNISAFTAERSRLAALLRERRG